MYSNGSSRGRRRAYGYISKLGTSRLSSLSKYWFKLISLAKPTPFGRMAATDPAVVAPHVSAADFLRAEVARSLERKAAQARDRREELRTSGEDGSPVAATPDVVVSPAPGLAPGPVAVRSLQRPAFACDGALLGQVASFFAERGLAPLRTFAEAVDAHAAASGGRRDGKGVSWPAFKGLLELHGCPLPEATTRRAFLAADSDGDGLLCRQEWVTLLTVGRRSVQWRASDAAPAVHLPPTWRKCRVLPGYCTTARTASGMNSVHDSCGAPDLATEALPLPALEEGMEFGRIFKWLVSVGAGVAKGEPIAEVCKGRGGPSLPRDSQKGRTISLQGKFRHEAPDFSPTACLAHVLLLPRCLPGSPPRPKPRGVGAHPDA